jgi:hypothetical protein
VNYTLEVVAERRESLERRAIAGLTDEETQAQLAGIRYRHTASGRVEIESKKDAKKRGQASPDRAEALVMAFTPIVPQHQTFVFDERVVISPI